MTTFPADLRRHRLTRRALCGGLAGVLATAASPAFAQFKFGFGGNSDSGTGGLFMDLNRIFGVLSNLFENLDEDDELVLADTLYPKFLERSGGVYPNDRVQDAIKRFAKPIFATSTRSRFNWDITVTNDNSLNAWAVPGGRVADHRGQF